MKTNKMLPDSSISKVWENFRKMNGIILELPVNNWVSQSNGTFTNTVSYEGFTSDEILEVDLYDDGTLTETQISEYDGYITEFNVEDGKIVAVATTKPTQSIKILARGEIVGKMVVNGGGSSNVSASNVSCLDKDGQTSNVQKELDEQNNNLTLDYSKSNGEISDLNTFLQKALEKLFPLARYLFMNGNGEKVISKTLTQTTGGYTSKITVNNDKIYLNSPAGASCTWYTEEPIDITYFKKIVAVAETYQDTGSTGGVYIGITKAKPSNNSTFDKNKYFATKLTKQDVFVDIEHMTGLYYIKIYNYHTGSAGTQFTYIYDLYLE